MPCNRFVCVSPPNLSINAGLRPNPKNNIQEAWRILDFLSFHEESVNIVSHKTRVC